MVSYSEGREKKKEAKKKEIKKDGEVYDVVPPLLPTSPLSHVGNEDGCHP
jgi:hypothetical protein